jgi:holo-[acyl-carrier protein] synthase
MSVVGIGTDIVEISRLEQMKPPAIQRLAQRVLTPSELKIFNKIKLPHRYLAKRWAAKEAASKALGTGIASGVSFQHIEITSLASGQPQIVFSDRALELARELGAESWHISISDEQSLATAFVVLSL